MGAVALIRCPQPKILRHKRGHGLRFAQANFTGRAPESLAALRWHPNFAQSAELQEILGAILNASGDKAGAQAAWTETLRLEPGRPGIDQKLKDLGNAN